MAKENSSFSISFLNEAVNRITFIKSGHLSKYLFNRLCEERRSKLKALVLHVPKYRRYPEEKPYVTEMQGALPISSLEHHFYLKE